MNAEGGDNVYRMKAAVSPAAETVISSEVNGTPGRYTYRAVTKDDGVAYCGFRQDHRRYPHLVMPVKPQIYLEMTVP